LATFGLRAPASTDEEASADASYWGIKMKKALLATTALVGASFMASAAMAKPEVRLGGFFNLQVGVATQDREGFGPSPGGVSPTNPERGYGVITDNEIIIRVSDKLDNGLSWSLKIELEANTDDAVDNGVTDASTADEAVLTFSGTWGQLFMGSEDGPVDTMKTGGKRATNDAGTGGVGGDFRRWVNWTTATTRFWSNAMDVRDSSDATKIAYITPRFAGFQAGVSFSPDREEEGRFRSSDNRADGSEQNFWELGANYDQKFDQFRVNVAGVLSLADNENNLREDTRAWGVGAMVGFGGLNVGAGYGSNGTKNRLSKAARNGDVTGWDVAVGYNMGAWDFGIGYFRSEAGNVNGSGEHVLQVATVGVTYDLGTGITTYIEGVWFDVDSAANNTTSFDNEGLALITGIGVEF
jgi:outer membrane protein OmpU